MAPVYVIETISHRVIHHLPFKVSNKSTPKNKRNFEPIFERRTLDFDQNLKEKEIIYTKMIEVQCNI